MHKRYERFQRSIRFSNDEWKAVTEAAERNDMTPGAFVRETATRAAAEKLDLDDGRLTPELIELFKRAFRGVHLLAYLKREELDAADRGENFGRAAKAARIAQAETFGPDGSDSGPSAASPVIPLRSS